MKNVFSRYSDSAKAREVWREYFKDIDRLGLFSQAEDILLAADSSTGLDLRLYQLISSHPPSSIDDRNSHWANVVRAIEEADNLIQAY